MYFVVKTSQETDSLIQAYIHQHVWMLFTLLAISMGDVIYRTEGSQSSLVDQEYTSLAAQVQNKCISISTHCLQKVPDDAEGIFMGWDGMGQGGAGQGMVGTGWDFSHIRTMGGW